MTGQLTDIVRSAPLLEIRNLNYEYGPRSSTSKGKSFAALRGIDLEIRAGSNLSLVGESGSGKSTFARCITRIERPTSGVIYFEGRNIGQLECEEVELFRSHNRVILQEYGEYLYCRF